LIGADTPPPPCEGLDGWLLWLQGLHSRTVDLGLERVLPVFQRLAPYPGKALVFMVGGTNGKGSTAGYLDCILRAAGYRTGLYTSPHLWRYTERIRLQGVEVAEADLLDAFARVEAQRQGVPLTYFEYGTLAAFDIFSRQGLDAWILEVGLGGRLDAVNLLDADAAIITSIALDHTEWLGPDRASIAREKAGIARQGRPLISGDPEPPPALEAVVHSVGAALWQLGRDFHASRGEHSWRWQGREDIRDALPLPALRGPHQLRNAACALTALHCLRERLPVSQAAVREGLHAVQLPGRFECLPGRPEWILDVAHNPAAAVSLTDNLRRKPIRGRTHLLFAAQAHKDWRGMLDALLPLAHSLTLAPLKEAQAAASETVRAYAASRLPDSCIHAASSLDAAVRHLGEEADVDDRIVVCGSFFTVAGVRRAHDIIRAGFPSAGMSSAHG
jgi:dihydrofolate synthase/folylpolyglutamate synthase